MAVLPEETRRQRSSIVRSLTPGTDRPHIERVAVCAVAMGEALRMTNPELLDLRYAAQLFDVEFPRTHRFLAQARKLIADARSGAPSTLGGKILLAAQAAADVEDVEEFLAQPTLMSRFDPQVVEALLRVAPLIQPMAS